MCSRLDEVSSIHYGKSPAKVVNSDGLFPIIGTGGEFGRASIPLFNAGVVVPRKGSLGNPQLALTPFWPTDTTFAVLPTEGIDIRWLYYCLLSFDLSRLNEATGVPSISRDWLSKIEFHNPGYKRQKRIAYILQTIDRAIEKTEALINKYQQIKAGLMHDLFTRGIGPDGQLRPPREKAPELYHETPIGWIPKDWRPMKLKEILRDSGGYLQTGPFGSQLHSWEYTTEGVPVVMPQDINHGHIDKFQIARIPEMRAQDLSKHRLRIGDIVIARRGDLNRAAAVNEDEQGWVCGTGCFLLRLDGSKLDSRMFSMAYRHAMVQRQVEGLSVGSTMPSLNNEVMGKLVFPYFGVKEQLVIAERVGYIDKNDETLVSVLRNLKKQKAGLMHDLLTGQMDGEVFTNEAEGLRKCL